ncbi:putative ubiquitinyl hydrolase 1 [Helianthus debilis subsp. tardiflorus]
MYLDVADLSTLSYGWSRCAQFSLAVVNLIHNKFTVRKGQQDQWLELQRQPTGLIRGQQAVVQLLQWLLLVDDDSSSSHLFGYPSQLPNPSPSHAL